VIRLMAGCARAVRVEAGPAIAASAAVRMVLRSIMAIPTDAEVSNQYSPIGKRMLLNKPLAPVRGQGYAA
jgi:hypothetical protein